MKVLPGVSTLSLEQFMGLSDVNLRTAKNTSLSIESVALILISDTSTNDPKMFDTLMSAFPHNTSEGAETVAPIIKKVAEVPDLLGDVKVIKRTIIPSKSELFPSF